MATARKCRAEEEVRNAVSRLQLQEVAGRVQAGWTGHGWGHPPSLWSKVTKKERKDLIVAEVTWMEQEQYHDKCFCARPERMANMGGCRKQSTQLGSRGKCHKLGWVSLLDHHQWFGTELNWVLYWTVSASLHHILSGCRISLTQGGFRWRHHQLLRKLAEAMEVRRQKGESRQVNRGTMEHQVLLQV